MKEREETRDTVTNSSLKDLFLKRIRSFENKKINSRYKLLEQLGTGGFGVVYKAEDIILKKVIAVKFLNPDYINNEKKFHRVKREINISRKITDKRVVKIFSLEEYKGIYFLIMEYLEGRSLKDKIREEGRIRWDEFMPVFKNILKGVKALHDQGIVHRDLKPSNIMLVGGDEIKILDFGMSKEVDDRELTSSIGELIGSPYYMSPEQANMGEVGKRSDIYQLGLILYRVLSGSMPFDDSQSTFELIYKRIIERPKKIDRRSLNIPKYVEFAIFKAIENKLTNRFGSIDEMILIFEREHYSVLEKIFHIMKKFKWKIALSSLLAILFTFVLLFWLSDNDVVSVKFNQNDISAYNNIGVRLWKKDFSPYTINTSFILDNRHRVGADTNKDNFSVDSKKILTLLNNHKEIGHASIASSEFDNQVSIMTNEGNELSKIGFFNFFDLGRYDFFKKFYASKIINTDPDRDGDNEKIIFIRHFMDMFPTAFIYIKDSNIYSFSNPGTISDYEILSSGKQNPRILLCGINNIVSHLFFTAEVSFPVKSNFLVKQSSIPNLRHNTLFLPEFLSFIPKFSSYDHSEWDTSDKLIFRDYWTGNTITLFRDHKMTIRNGKETRTYSDDRDTLYKIYNLINRYYVEKVINNNKEIAYRKIVESIESGPQNPFLLSALLFFSGDLEIDMGNIREGRKSLLRSLELYSYNRDSAQRLCEADFLEENPLAAYGKVSEKFGHIDNFWGISSGKEIFKSYCMMQAGEFSRAEEILSLSVFKSNLSNSRTFSGIIKLFSGDYEDSYRILSGIDKNRIFTVAESRLFVARAMVLSGKDIEKAEYFFSDIAMNSISLSPLAKISNHFLKLKNGEKKIRLNDVKRDFEDLIRLSAGNFQARLWLFYDAYIYGQIMEEINNVKEAVRGYELSIGSNPHTELASQSKRRLAELKNE